MKNGLTGALATSAVQVRVCSTGADEREVGHPPVHVTTEAMMSAFDFGNLIAFSTVSIPAKMTVCERTKVHARMCACACVCDSVGKLYDSAEVLKSPNEGGKLWLFVHR